jgi:hypothetical protein
MNTHTSETARTAATFGVSETTAQRRLATFNARHSHLLFPIARAFVARFEKAFGPIRSMVDLETKAERFDFGCVVATFCKHAHDLGAMSPMIEAIGERLSAFGFTRAHVPAARSAFLQALREHSGAAWTAEIERDWAGVVDDFFGRMSFEEAARPMRMAA